MRFYKYCPVCGHITTVPISKCTFCDNNEIVDTNIEVPDLFYQFKHKDEIEQQIEAQYKIKENPLYNEEAVQHRLQEEQKEHDKFYNGKSQNYGVSTPNVPKCPTCGSTNVSKLSTTSKVVGTSLLGLASKTIGKTYKCKNCGYYW